MKKLLAFCCAAIIAGHALATPFFTYHAAAADTDVFDGVEQASSAPAEESAVEEDFEEDGASSADEGVQDTESSGIAEESPEASEAESSDAPEEDSGSSADETEEDSLISPQEEAEGDDDTAGESSDDAVGEDAAKDLEQARAALADILQDHTVMALVYLSDSYLIRAEASNEAEVVAQVPSGQQVLIEDVTRDELGSPWVYVTLSRQGMQYSGYIAREYLACSDERFLTWEEEYGMKTAPARAMRMAAPAATYADIEQFPASYRAALTALKKAHPNWTFVQMKTGLEWDTVVREEMVRPRSLIPTSFPAAMKDGDYGQGWSYASRAALEYYLDPRNWLTDQAVFQFEQLTYNASYHTQSAVQNFLNGTFMKGNAPKSNKSYAQVFWEVGKTLGVSPFHLASRVRQEQGQGQSALISGTYSGYEGYYNYFNIKASGSTDAQVISSGLAHAKSQGWTSAEASILGGAKVISKDYILGGQDTLYLQKFDVDDSDGQLFWFQYMQNICAPSSEGQMIYDLYRGAGSLENTFVFKIPVYNNMPSSASPKPVTADYRISLTRPSGYSGTTVYLDGVAYTATANGNNLTVDAGKGTFKSAVMYKYDASGIPVGMYVWTLSHNGSMYNVTAMPELQDVLTYEGFAIRITGKSGMRFVTSISKDLRAKLLKGSVGGYTLKEYGTLAMNNGYTNQLPMVVGGKNVTGSLAYGYNSSGALQNFALKLEKGRYHYTGVLVGMPAAYYKTDYAFRGYITLTKNGQQITLYGPIVARNIYSLAKQLIDSNRYQVGSTIDVFLKKLIADGDAA